jgi:hypothetical protein
MYSPSLVDYAQFHTKTPFDPDPQQTGIAHLHKRSDSLTWEHVYTSSVSHSQPATCPAASSDASARKYGSGGISGISNVRGAPQAVQGWGRSVSARASSGGELKPYLYQGEDL